MVAGFVGLGRGYWDCDGRGGFLGLSGGTEKEEFMGGRLE